MTDEHRHIGSDAGFFCDIAEPEAPHVQVQATLANPEGRLRPGMFVKVGFIVGEAQRLLVPRQSIVERGEVTALYVVDDEGRTSLRQVRLGHRFADSVQVLAGVTKGDRIALDPIAALKRLQHIEEPS